MKAHSVPGFHDRLPTAARKKWEIIKRCEEISKKFCFNIIETPHVELAEVLTKGGEEIQKEIYLFKDKGGRDIGLRFDLTVPLSRFVRENYDKIEMPFKRLAFGSVFRGEKPQKGRFREFTQVDFDIVGSASFDCQVEVVDLLSQIIRSLDINYTIKVSDKYLGLELADIFQTFDKPAFLRLLDKASKLNEVEFAQEAARIIPANMVEELVKLKNTPGAALEKIRERSLQKDHIRRVLSDLLAFTESISSCEIDPFIVRGLDYYTGLVFEIFAKDTDIGAISSGGRYDNLICTPRNEYLPAFGGSLGLDRILALLEEPEAQYDVFIVRLRENNYPELRDLQSRLIQLGFSCEVYFEELDVKKQLRYVERKGFRFVVFVRKGEISVIEKSSQAEKKFQSVESALNYFKGLNSSS